MKVNSANTDVHPKFIKRGLCKSFCRTYRLGDCKYAKVVPRITAHQTTDEVYRKRPRKNRSTDGVALQILRQITRD